jgi:hypothetical protein
MDDRNEFVVSIVSTSIQHLLMSGPPAKLPVPRPACSVAPRMRMACSVAPVTTPVIQTPPAAPVARRLACKPARRVPLACSIRQQPIPRPLPPQPIHRLACEIAPRPMPTATITPMPIGAPATVKDKRHPHLLTLINRPYGSMGYNCDGVVPQLLAHDTPN